MAGLFEELKRRNVVRVGVAYLAASWLILQVIDLVIENVAAPPWVMQFILASTAIGFPIVLAFAWAFELTPEGVKRERDVDRSQSITSVTGRRLNRVITVVLVIAIGLLLVDKFLLRSTAPEQIAEESAPAEVVDNSSRRSVAVLPFANRSNAEADAFFVDGIHDDILTQLAKISALKVISRTSVMQYRDTEKPMRDIGEELDVGTIMEGSVQRAGDRVRINVQLIDANTDEHIWAEVYDRGLTAANIFEIQTEIARTIAGELRANLTEREAERIALRPTENFEAYEAYLLGRQWMTKRTTAAIAQAKAYFEQAINLDPDFSLAYVGISETIILLVDYGGAYPADVAREAEPYIKKALELDPDSGEALFSLATVYEYERDYDAATEAYIRGLELAPNYAMGRMWYALHLQSVRGLQEAALEQYRIASEFDPLSAINYANLSATLETLGRFDESLAYLDKVDEVDPAYGFSHMLRGYRLWAIDGRIDQAMTWLFSNKNLDPGDPQNHTSIAQAYVGLGDDETAWCWMDSAITIKGNGRPTMWSLAYLTALRGDMSDAADIGRRAASVAYRRAEMSIPLGIIKAEFLISGNPRDAITAYDEFYPEFARTPTSDINSENFLAAVDYADLLMRSGQADRSSRLLERIESYIRNVPRLSFFGSKIADVQIHTIRGNLDQALAALREAVDEGWRMDWRYYYEIDTTLDPLRSSPEFEAAFSIIQRDMAGQLENVRAWETIETRCTN
jgi:TolB-like protein/Flp pilus assembly protein TadD